MTEQKITLPDGRTLAYTVYGAVDGQPLLYFHGTPSSRLEILFLNSYNIDPEQALVQTKLKLIAVDRPGMGLSSFHPAGSFLSFTDDVAFLLNALEITGCPLLCWSGGGPYALAMAWKYAYLIKDVFILCGFSTRFTKKVFQQMSTNKWYFRTAKYFPWLLTTAMNQLRNGTPRFSVPQWLTGLCDVDYQLIKDPRHLKAISDYSFKEACRQNAKGAAHEAQLYFQDFGFDITEVMQPVHYWWGTEDNTVVRLHAEAIERRVPKNAVHYIQGEGHLSLYINYFEEVLRIISAS